jgi:cyclic beta-1,2-glucan synthetase
VTLTNTDREPHDIELTSYGEIVMAPLDADRAHPAFSNLFVETEWHAWCSAITATRRPRTPGRRAAGACTWSTPDRIDSATPPARPIAPASSDAGARCAIRRHSMPGAALSGTTGAVLDPIFAVRARVRVNPGTGGQRDLHHPRRHQP